MNALLNRITEVATDAQRWPERICLRAGIEVPVNRELIERQDAARKALESSGRYLNGKWTGLGKTEQ